MRLAHSEHPQKLGNWVVRCKENWIEDLKQTKPVSAFCEFLAGMGRRELGGGACILGGGSKACSAVSKIPPLPYQGPGPSPLASLCSLQTQIRVTSAWAKRIRAAAWEGNGVWAESASGTHVSERSGTYMVGGVTVPTTYCALLERHLESPAWDWGPEDCCFYFWL